MLRPAATTHEATDVTRVTDVVTTAVDDEATPAERTGDDVVPANVEGQGGAARSPRSLVIEVSALVLGPIALLVVLRTQPYFALNNGDPYIYAGYAGNFRQLVERFGYTYYSVRFGIFFPVRAGLVFGPEWGYLVVKYTQIQMCVLSAYAVLRPRGWKIAAFAASLVVCSPVVVQSVLSTYADSMIVPALAVTVAAFVLARRTESLRRALGYGVLAGFVTGLGVNSNVFSIPMFGIAAVVGALALERRFGWRRACVCLAVWLAAIIAVTLGASLLYRHIFGDGDIFSSTINAFKDLSATTYWTSPTLEWLSFRRYIYAPLAAFTLAAVVIVRSRPKFLRSDLSVVFLTTSSMIAVNLIHQFVMGGATMEQAYYFSYTIVPILLLIPLALIEQWPQSVRWWWWVVPPLAAATTRLLDVSSFVVFAAIFLGLLAIVVRAHGVAVMVAIVFAVHACWGMGPRDVPVIQGAAFAYEPHYERAFGTGDTGAFDGYRMGAQLPEIVPSIGAGSPPLLFWYRSGDALLDEVQASYLWELLAVQRRPFAGMPDLTADDVARLNTVIGGHLVLLARSAEELDAGVQSLTSKGWDVETSKGPVLLEPAFRSVWVQVLDVHAGPST